MFDNVLFRNIKYYTTFQLIFVAGVIILSSVGAFFHFLLDHEISIVEAWLHNNKWEILIISKLLSLFLVHRWFSMRLYELKSLQTLVHELVHWPDPTAIVISAFMLISYLVMGNVVISHQNMSFWYLHFLSFSGMFLFFAIDFVVMAHLEDVLNQKEKPRRLPLGIFYIGCFTAAYLMTVPDYYGLLPYVIFTFSTLLYLSGAHFTSWSNVVCFLLVFVAPMGAVFGLDPVWGDDFSPFRVERKLGLTFLAVIWVISFGYYQFRNRLVGFVRKFLR